VIELIYTINCCDLEARSQLLRYQPLANGFSFEYSDTIWLECEKASKGKSEDIVLIIAAQLNKVIRYPGIRNFYIFVSYAKGVGP
jgi:hypothetical protein